MLCIVFTEKLNGSKGLKAAKIEETWRASHTRGNRKHIAVLLRYGRYSSQLSNTV